MKIMERVGWGYIEDRELRQGGTAGDLRPWVSRGPDSAGHHSAAHPAGGRGTLGDEIDPRRAVYHRAAQLKLNGG
jgi:hypothetical protein